MTPIKTGHPEPFRRLLWTKAMSAGGTVLSLGHGNGSISPEERGHSGPVSSASCHPRDGGQSMQGQCH